MGGLTGYQPHIKEACGCTDEEVGAVEELMRMNNGGVLDSLRPARFDAAARFAYEVLKVLREEDPGCAARLTG